MGVEIVTEVDDELVNAINHLLPQLSRLATALSAVQVQDLLSQSGTPLFVYRSDQPGSAGNYPILGMLTLVTFKIPTGTRAFIEDVVVDEATRGQGAGRKLVEAALDYATVIGAKTVDLTSRPSRKAANALYQSAGFERRETNVYRWSGR